MPVNHSTREQVLAALRSPPGNGSWQSGEALATALGISRVAIWKAIEGLRAGHYPIASSKEGYRLEGPGPEDALEPWEFPGRANAIHRWATTDSTMERARELALQGARDGTIALAEAQEAGRGRQGRKWHSEKGGLFFTLVTRPRLAAQDYLRGVFAIQVAAARAIERLSGLAVAVAWPNDLYVSGRKLGGVLPEFHARGDYIEWLTLGVGINVYNHPPGAATICGAATLSSAAALPGSSPHPGRRDLLAAILDELVSPELADPAHPDLVAAWEARLALKGQRVALTSPFHGEGKVSSAQSAGRIEGYFLGVDSLGRCRIKEGNSEHSYSSAQYSLAAIPHTSHPTGRVQRNRQP